MSGESNEHTRLYGVGLESSRAFTDAYLNNQITRQEAAAEVPSGVMAVLAGPSTDFIAGRLFEAAMYYATERVMQQDEKPNKWITGPDKSIAEDKFVKGNCALIR
jgi:hypothetical protein